MEHSGNSELSFTAHPCPLTRGRQTTFASSPAKTSDLRAQHQHSLRRHGRGIRNTQRGYGVQGEGNKGVIQLLLRAVQDVDSIRAFLLALMEEFLKRHHFASVSRSLAEGSPSKPPRQPSIPLTPAYGIRTPRPAAHGIENFLASTNPVSPPSPSPTTLPEEQPTSADFVREQRLLDSAPLCKRARLTPSVAVTGRKKSKWIDDLIAVRLRPIHP